MKTTTTPNLAVRRLAMLSAAALLSGCAALQIDVDVYKGPLVYDEETQVQQLASVAMSGKTLLLLQRNKWLSELNVNWAGTGTNAADLRTRHLNRSEWGAQVKDNQCTKTDTDRSRCRNARLVNDMLSAYEDRGEPGLAHAVNAVSDHYDAYKVGRNAYLKERKVEAKATLQREANEALRQTWGALVDLLQVTKSPPPDDDSKRTYKSTGRQTADLIANLTEPVLLACAEDLVPQGSLKNIQKEMSAALESGAGPFAIPRATSLLSNLLRQAKADELPRLRSAMDLQVKTTKDSKGLVENCLGTPNVKQASRASTAKLGNSGDARTGVHREATGKAKDEADKDLDDDLKDIDNLVGDLAQLGAVGFDRGRSGWGLDRLADEAARGRFTQHQPGQNKEAALAAERQVLQLQDGVVDLASRMQFLAVNMGVVDSTASKGNQAFKTTLESIANTLLVLAEDQRRQRKHRLGLEGFAGAESAAAQAALKPDTWPIKTNPKTVLETLDRVEAYLSYSRAVVLQRAGSTSKAVQDIDHALASLDKRRERMAYLRPASSYLRSALASTSQQADPRLEWSNLLSATLKRLLGAQSEDSKNAAAVRAELDKSFWQSVNQVKVSGAGKSNFAIAKDDVGNWYVKAMGIDPAAMVNAAKNLALFNLGGRIDSNLLRIDELRNRTRSTDNKDSNAETAKDEELKDLVDGKNGASATAYGNTLQVFSANHSTVIKALVKEVKTTLENGALAAALNERWDNTYLSGADSAPAQRMLLPTLAMTAGSGAMAPLHDAARAAVEQADKGGAAPLPSAQLIKALGLLAQQRGEIKAQVNAAKPALTLPETNSLKTSQQEAAALETAMAQLQLNRAATAKDLALLEPALATLPSPPPGAPANDQVSKLKAKLAEQSQDIATKQALHATALANTAKAQAALTAARDKHAKALADVDAVWQRFIKDLATRQLRAVEELETAARVVSQGVRGSVKTTSP